MSPEAIQSLIEMFGVEKGIQIMNLFSATDEADAYRKSAVGIKPIRSEARATADPLVQAEPISA